MYAYTILQMLSHCGGLLCRLKSIYGTFLLIWTKNVPMNRFTNGNKPYNLLIIDYSENLNTR